MIRYNKRIGGIRFCRIGRFAFTFAFARKPR